MSHGRVVIHVIDNGPGIDPVHLENIFVPFFTTKRGGTGVGLSISRQLVQANHGFISVKPGEGSGTVFVLSLPRARLCLAYCRHFHAYGELVRSAAEDDAAQGRDIGEIPPQASAM